MSSDGSRSNERSVSVTVGPMTLAPVSYNSFTVGAVTMARVLSAGEDADAATEELRALATKQFRKSYAAALDEYMRAMRDAGDTVHRNARGRAV